MRLDRALAHLERYPFHMPGHKRNPDFGLPGAEIDITEIDGYDDLHAPTGVLARLQADLAALYGAGASFLSVNVVPAAFWRPYPPCASRGTKFLLPQLPQGGVQCLLFEPAAGALCRG